MIRRANSSLVIVLQANLFQKKSDDFETHKYRCVAILEKRGLVRIDNCEE